MKNRTFVINTFYLVIGLFTLQISFNYLFDSYGFFRKNNSLEIAAKAIAEGHIMAVPTNYDDRIFQKKVFDYFPEKPQCIVIGSSRSMMVESRMVQCSGKFFNHSVSGASLEDAIAILGLYAQNNTLPKKVILGIDPWIFNKHNNQKRWRRLNESYSFLTAQITQGHTKKILPKDQSRYLQLINFENTKYNLLFLKQTLKNENGFKIIDNENIDSIIKRPDGSIIYPFKTRYQKDTATLIEAKNYLTPPVYSVENFDELANIQLFEQLIRYLKKQHVEVLFYLPPYHPLAYTYLSNTPKYKNILYAENYLRGYAQKHNIKILGSYNPDVYHFHSIDFTDGMHGKVSVAERIFTYNP